MNEPFLRLDGQRTTYLLDVASGTLPVCRYWGPRLPPGLQNDLAALQQRPSFPASLDQAIPLSILPEQGQGAWGQPGLIGERDQKAWATLFRFSASAALPNGWQLTYQDPVAGLQLELEVLLDSDSDVLQRRSRLINQGLTGYRVLWLASGAFEVPSSCQEWLTLYGSWANEFRLTRQPWTVGTLLRENRRGRTSHECFPGVIVGEAHFSESWGHVYGFHLGWSSNHRVLAEKQAEGASQVQLGELLTPGEVVLGQGEHYTSPWVYASYAIGLNALSQQFHQFVREKILPSRVASRPRPVQFNSWEAIYFKHDLPTLCQLATQAAEVGAERFVLDDGWFPGRDHDRAGLGDWWVDRQKYPQGLHPLIEHVESLGMEFGLWIEPEMVNPESQLYRNHPDWVLHLDSYPRTTGRFQLVLDLRKTEVADYLFECLSQILREYPKIAYLKWDMNRDFTFAGTEGRPAYRAQNLAFYALWDRLRQAFPKVEIESCASGGGRIDYEVLKRAERVWTSDSNDAVQRQFIQRGYSLFFPPEIMGTHLGPATCHTTGRKLSLNFRAQTAFGGHTGMECDLRELSEADRRELKAILAEHKRLRNLLHRGLMWRLELADSGRLGWGVVAPTGKHALYAVAQIEAPFLGSPLAIRLPGLWPELQYRLRLLTPLDPALLKLLPQAERWTGEGWLAPGKFLSQSGIVLALPNPETSVLIELIAE